MAISRASTGKQVTKAPAKKKRNYKKEYADYHGKSGPKKDRASRNNARRAAVRSGVARKGDGKDVDHIDGNPRNNAPKNKRVISKSKNRSKK
jgi:hypothetical protein